MPSWKKVIVSGSDASLNSLNVTANVAAQSFTGPLFGTASYATNADLLDDKDSSVFATTGSNIFRGNQTVTGSLFTTGSNTLVGSTSLTGSLNITGSTIQVGSNTLLGNTTLSGSITISGSLGSVPSVKIYGDTQHNGYIRFDPVTTNINTAISASYIYVSGSTNDLYFSQNGSGYSNTTRLRWLEGNLYTGLLHGGLITTQSSTVYQISSGSGIIVDLNASLSDDPYPTIQFLQWGNLSASIAPFTASFQQAFVGIDSTNNIYAQGTPFSNGQFDTVINIGNVLFQNQSTINGVKTQPSVAYGFEQQQNTFNRAFGPLKLSGYTLAPSGSSTGSLIVASGTAYAPGSNYTINPNEPYYTVDSGTNVSKIFRYHQSGSTWVYNTNAGAGFTSIDPTQYSNNGVLTAVPGGGSNRQWSIQRVFYFPNSVTKAIVVYYGNATYTTEVDAIANISFESFVEAPNTAANAIYLGALVLRNDADFTTPATYKIQPGGLFRQVGGSGGGGSVITQTLAGLSDVLISGPTNGQALVYDSTAAKWENKSFISASISGNAATATTASFATTASYVLNAVSASFSTTASYVLNAVSSSYALTSSNVQGGAQYYVPLWNTNTSLTSSYLNQSGSVLKTIYSGADKGLTLDYNFDNFILGNVGTGNNTYFQVYDGGGTINVYTPNYTYFNDKVGIRTIPTNPGLAIYGSLEVTGPGTTKFMGTEVEIDGNLFMSGSNSLIYDNNVSNSMLFGFFDGSSIYGPYYQIFGNNYTDTTQRGSAEFVYDNRNGGGSGFNIASFNGTTWTRKFRVDDNGAQVTGSLIVTGGITGSLHGTASWAENAITASHSLNTISASFATNADLLDGKDSTVFATTGSNQFSGSQTITGSLTVTGQIIAQTLNVQQVTSSIIYSSGSNIFGNSLSDTQQFTGSVSITGSANIVGNTTITGSLTVTGGITGSLFGTASWAQNAITSSFVTASNVFGPFGSNSVISASFATTASYVLNAVSASFATSSSFAQNTISASYAVTASILRNDTAKVSASSAIYTSGSSLLYNLSEFKGAMVDYVVSTSGSGTSTRAGTFTAVWNSVFSSFNESTTMDIGNTDAVSFSADSTGSIFINVTSGSWEVDSLYRALGKSIIATPSPITTVTVKFYSTGTSAPLVGLTCASTSSYSVQIFGDPGNNSPTFCGSDELLAIDLTNILAGGHSIPVGSTFYLSSGGQVRTWIRQFDNNLAYWYLDSCQACPTTTTTTSTTTTTTTIAPNLFTHGTVIATCSDYCNSNYNITTATVADNDYASLTIGDTIYGQGGVAGYVAYSNVSTNTTTGPFKVAQINSSGVIIGITECSGGSCVPV